MTVAQPYLPPPLNPLKARFCNLLLTRDRTDGFDFFGRQCSFSADPWQAPFVPACGLNLEVRGETWQALFSSPAPMRLHPAGACIGGTARLPEELRLALFELSLAPVLNALTEFFGLGQRPAILSECGQIPEGAACAVPLSLRLPDEDVAVTVCIPSRDSATALLHGLARRKPRRNPMPGLLLPVALETGSMRLTVPDLASLKPEDVLLPETYPGIRGELCLRLSDGVGIRCAVDNGRAVVIGFERGSPWSAEKETRREEMADAPTRETPLDSASQGQENRQSGTEAAAPERDGGAALAEPAIDLDALEMTVTFELDRRLLSIAEITALESGYTFTLPADPAGPVTVRVNGKRLGTGRLVDIGGSLGVQLVSLERD